MALILVVEISELALLKPHKGVDFKKSKGVMRSTHELIFVLNNLFDLVLIAYVNPCDTAIIFQDIQILKSWLQGLISELPTRLGTEIQTRIRTSIDLSTFEESELLKVSETGVYPIAINAEATPYASEDVTTYMCSGCAKVLRFQMNRCPICRQPVERLLEIKGLEDHLGDMDFKIAGTRNGITTIQLVIKPVGIPLYIICESLKHAYKG
ncbi:hypothetical protein L1987_87724 [Smallanthus sonchifolius]|nr:hypothetical protein L1987_87724 [Smallanthus sonchifolius]